MTASPEIETSTVPLHAPQLTERETLVLRLLAEGYTVTQIQPRITQPVQKGPHAGEAPGKRAAQGVIEKLRIKLSAHTMAQVVHHAHRLGLLA